MTSCCSLSHLLLAATRRLEAAGIPADEALAEARLLLQAALGLSREQMYLRPDADVDQAGAARFDSLVARRERREPLAYITGTRAFYGLDFTVSPAVLIPRPETELLVEAALRHLEGVETPRIADVGTGSGCIAIALAAHLPRARAWASDISPEALEVARANAERYDVAARFTLAEGDRLKPLAASAPFDTILSNPPYIGEREVDALMPEVRDWEPRVALTPGDDALAFYRHLANEAPPLLAAGGLLAVEVGQRQAEAVAALWTEADLKEVNILPDYAGIGRVVRGIAR